MEEPQNKMHAIAHEMSFLPHRSWRGMMRSPGYVLFAFFCPWCTEMILTGESSSFVSNNVFSGIRCLGDRCRDCVCTVPPQELGTFHLPPIVVCDDLFIGNKQNKQHASTHLGVPLIMYYFKNSINFLNGTIGTKSVQNPGVHAIFSLVSWTRHHTSLGFVPWWHVQRFSLFTFFLLIRKTGKKAGKQRRTPPQIDLTRRFDSTCGLR